MSGKYCLSKKRNFDTKMHCKLIGWSSRRRVFFHSAEGDGEGDRERERESLELSQQEIKDC